MYYDNLDSDALNAEFSAVKKRYDEFKNKGISLDMSRGKPGPEQMDISKKMFSLIGEDGNFNGTSGIDCRNYGCLDGLPELKKLFSEILGVSPEHVIVGGNSSLNMMFDTIAQFMSHGLTGNPWTLNKKNKFICPCPGYDRHFAICEYFGIEMIPVENNADGPDMNKVSELVKDPAVNGMWCVPKYSNPEGIVYSDDVVRKIANLKPASPDFRVFWDNAYAIHGLYDTDDKLLNIYNECVKAGNPNLVIQFASTSKITFPGAGVAAQAAGPDDINVLKHRMMVQTIGPDKLNQLRHSRLFPNYNSLILHMEKHAEILRPKFNIVLESFEKELSGLGIAEWTTPHGGYFISLDLLDGMAKRTHQLCKEAGLILTGAGAVYPYGNDPRDRNLRIAPSYPTNEELKKACELLCICIKYAALEKKVI